MFARRYAPPVCITDEPYPLLLAPRTEHEDEAYGPMRLVVDVAVRAKSRARFEVSVVVTPDWVLPFPECDPDTAPARRVSGELAAGEECCFRILVEAEYEMAGAEVAALVGAGEVDVLLLGWESV
jgi:hypothetical protein